MTSWPVLSLTIFLPLLGAAFIACVRGEKEVVARNARAVALWTSLITFVLSLFLWFGFDRADAGFQFVEPRLGRRLFITDGEEAFGFAGHVDTKCADLSSGKLGSRSPDYHIPRCRRLWHPS